MMRSIFIHSAAALLLNVLCVITSGAQSIRSSLFERALKEKTTSETVLLVLVPPDNWNTDSGSVRYGGVVEPGIQVTLNGKELKVYSSGAFAGLTRISPGKNILRFTATTSWDTITKTITVSRTRPTKTTPSSPLAFDSKSPMEPQKDILCRMGDLLHVRFKASEGHKATFRVGDRNIYYPMNEIAPVRTEGIGGIYEGYYTVQPSDVYRDARVIFYLHDKRKKSRYIKTLAPGKITVDRTATAHFFTIKSAYTALYPVPSGGARLFSTHPDTLLYSVGRVGDMLKISLSPSFTGWVDEHNVIKVPSSPYPDFAIRSISLYTRGNSSILEIGLPCRLPVRSLYEAGEHMLVLDLFGAHPGIRWINHKHEGGLIKDVSLSQVEDRRTKIKVLLNEPLLGYRVRYEKNSLLVQLKPMSLLRVQKEAPLGGLTICLDAGHGGSDRGALGNTGLYEKDVNQFLVKLIQTELETLGASVLLSMDTDTTLPNGTRVDRLNNSNADLIISVHNNSVGFSDNPLGARGISTYYHQPQGKEFALGLYRDIRSECPELAPYGVIQSDHFLLRETTIAPCVILEGLFLSNPLDETLLMDDDFCKRFVTGIVLGVVTYVKRVREKQEPEHKE